MKFLEKGWKWGPACDCEILGNPVRSICNQHTCLHVCPGVRSAFCQLVSRHLWFSGATITMSGPLALYFVTSRWTWCVLAVCMRERGEGGNLPVGLMLLYHSMSMWLFVRGVMVWASSRMVSRCDGWEQVFLLSPPSPPCWCIHIPLSQKEGVVVVKMVARGCWHGKACFGNFVC